MSKLATVSKTADMDGAILRGVWSSADSFDSQN